MTLIYVVKIMIMNNFQMILMCIYPSVCSMNNIIYINCVKY